MEQTQPKQSMWPQLVVMTAARLCINIGIRMVYPFAPALARGVGVEISAVYQLISLRNLSGLVSPLFGPVSEKYGRKPVMMAATLFFAVACGLLVAFPAYWPLALALTAAALAKVIFDPAMQAYIGDTVAYARRGRAIAVTEYSWALALLLGGPLVGLAMARGGWVAPFAWLAVLSVLAVVVLQIVLPRLPRKEGASLKISAVVGLVRQHPVMLAVAGFVALEMGANELLLIVFGDWMEGSFNLSLASLGLSAAVIGGAELLGETVAGVAVDRFGKRPIVITTGILKAVFYAIMPFMSSEMTPALVTLFVLFVLFEITVVGSIPLMTEVVPGARSVVMSLSLGGAALGRAAGAWLGPMIWAQGGFWLTGLTAAGVMILAVLVLWRWVREGEA